MMGMGLSAVWKRLLDAEGIYMNAPFFVDDANTAELLLETSSIKETLNLAKQADIALLGVGSLDLSQCSFYLAGYVPKSEISGNPKNRRHWRCVRAVFQYSR
jgi:DNA-binding transcriptional regulator LsrR (DeoR family)